MYTVKKPFKCVVCESPTQYKGDLCDACEAEVQAAEADEIVNEHDEMKQLRSIR